MTHPADTASSSPSDVIRENAAKLGACNALNVLLDQGYFSEPRKPVEIRKHWATAIGRLLSSAEMAIALRRAVSLGKVRRIAIAGPGYLYEEVDSTRRGSFHQRADRGPKITLGEAAAIRRKNLYNEVVGLASRGKTRAEIAAAVGITMRTVSRYFAKARQENLNADLRPN